MTLPKKLYESLKFIIKLCPWVMTFISGLFIKLGITDETTSLITFLVSAAGALATLIVEYCKANHYKVKADDGTTEEITFDTQTATESITSAAETATAETEAENTSEGDGN